MHFKKFRVQTVKICFHFLTIFNIRSCFRFKLVKSQAGRTRHLRTYYITPPSMANSSPTPKSVALLMALGAFYVTALLVRSNYGCYPSCLEQYMFHSVGNMKRYWNRCVLRQTNTYYLNLIESSHKLISKIQPVVTQVLRSRTKGKPHK